MPAVGLLTPNNSFIDEDGNPASGWLLYTYLVGTDTPAATYQDSDLLIANTNPIELDAAGNATIYVSPDYGLNLVMHDADDVLVWSQDGVFPPAVAT